MRRILGLSLLGGTIAALGGSFFTAFVVVTEFAMPFSRELSGVLVGMLGELAGFWFVAGALAAGALTALLTGARRTGSIVKLWGARSKGRSKPAKTER